MGAYFLEQLRGIKSTHIREIRGVGLMIGVELKTRVGPILRELLEQGFMVLNAGPTVVRFLPPLNVSRSEVEVIDLGDGWERVTVCDAISIQGNGGRFGTVDVTK